jgi:single-strand DNA-binding protein
MANLNKIFLIGNLTRDPELRYIPSGSAVTTFTVAVNRVYTQQGEKKEEVSFIKVVVWAKMAEVCGEYLSKGSPVFVEGRLQSRSWETPQGEKRSAMEVVAERVQFLGRGKSGKPEAGVDQTADYDEGALPLEGGASGKNEPKGQKSSSGEEIPF